MKEKNKFKLIWMQEPSSKVVLIEGIPPPFEIWTSDEWVVYGYKKAVLRRGGPGTLTWANLSHKVYGHKGQYSTVDTAKRVAERYELATNKLVYFKSLPTDARGGQKGSFKDYLTELGDKVIKQAENMVVTRIAFKGCNSKGIYLKWLLEGKDKRAKPVDENEVKVYRDWLIDQGLSTQITYLNTKSINFEHRIWIKLDIQ